MAGSKHDFAKDIYRIYCRLSQDQGEKPFSYVYFYSNLSYLQSLSLAALISTKLGKTYANRVMLTFERKTMERIWQLRFEQ